MKVFLNLAREQRRILVPAAALSVFAAVVSLAQPVVVNGIIGAVQRRDPVVALVLAACALFVTVGVAMSVQQYLLQRMGEGVVLSARRSLVSALLRLPIVEFDRRRAGDLVSRVSSDTTVLRLALTQGVLAGVGGVITMFGALGALVYIDPLLLGVTLLIVSVFAVATTVLAGRVRRASQEVQSRVGSLTAAVDRAVRGIRTLRAGNAVGREEAVIQGHAKASWLAGVRLAKASAVIEPMSVLAMQAALITVLGVGGYRVASGQLPVQDLVSFLMFVFLLVAPLAQIFAAVGTFGSALGALDRIQEIRALPSEDEVRRGKAGGAVTAVGGERNAVSFHDVRFDYDPDSGGTGRSAALKGVSFEVERGSKVALVGPSGAGKTTTLNLIVGFYNPDSGVVVVDGTDSQRVPADQVRAGVAYVEQDAPALAGTVRDNLTISAPNATDAECWEALASVSLSDVVERSGGLDSEIGESGVLLSGGERQRLAISRALLARPKLLLLDESTSNLDGRNEMLARDAVRSVADGCTMLVVAHRLSTVVDSDLILVFDEGEIVARGSHDVLLAECGLYRELARHQLIS